MRELVFDIPLDVNDPPSWIFPHAQVLHVLRIDPRGFVFVCRASSKGVSALKSSLKDPSSPNLEIENLGRENDGDIILKVSGTWPSRRNPRALEFFQSVESMPIYSLNSPSVEGKQVRISVVADESKMRRFMAGLTRSKVPFKVVRLARLRVRSGPSAPAMTPRQMQVLRLAHTLGYYEIPRKVSTARLASILGMDKGTVGDHLRRAEKHAFDDLLGF